jgi:hypothetical protein
MLRRASSSTRNFSRQGYLDAELAGARNVFIKIGNAVYLDDQPPEPWHGSSRFGIQTINETSSAS